MSLTPSRLLLSPSELLRAMGGNTLSLSPRSRLNSSSGTSISGHRRVSGVPITLLSLLFASTEVLALALLSPAAVFVRWRRAAVALSAAAGTAAEGTAAVGTAAASVAAVGTAATCPAASCTAAATDTGAAEMAADEAVASPAAADRAATWAALLFSFCTSCLLLSFSLLLWLGGRFLQRF